MATPVRASSLPPGALLAAYRSAGHYTDCYETRVDAQPFQAAYVEAFYTSWLFKLERRILALASMPSTDAEAAELAAGTREHFAAWRVEARAPEQLLLCDVHARTRSWLMSADAARGAGRTLYFGSAIVPAPGAEPGAAALDFPYGALLGFHRRYSRLLLGAAAARLERGASRLQ
jgi:hypothetical protein